MHIAFNACHDWLKVVLHSRLQSNQSALILISHCSLCKEALGPWLPKKWPIDLIRLYRRTGRYMSLLGCPDSSVGKMVWFTTSYISLSHRFESLVKKTINIKLCGMYEWSDCYLLGCGGFTAAGPRTTMTFLHLKTVNLNASLRSRTAWFAINSINVSSAVFQINYLEVDLLVFFSHQLLTRRRIHYV